MRRRPRPPATFGHHQAFHRAPVKTDPEGGLDLTGQFGARQRDIGSLGPPDEVHHFERRLQRAFAPAFGLSQPADTPGFERPSQRVERLAETPNARHASATVISPCAGARSIS